jgi:hypothetical protein
MAIFLCGIGNIYYNNFYLNFLKSMLVDKSFYHFYFFPHVIGFNYFHFCGDFFANIEPKNEKGNTFFVVDSMIF